MTPSQRLSFGLVDVSALLEAYIERCGIDLGGKDKAVQTFDSYIDSVCKNPVIETIAAFGDRDAAGIRRSDDDKPLVAV